MWRITPENARRFSLAEILLMVAMNIEAGRGLPLKPLLARARRAEQQGTGSLEKRGT
jgi:hypothetical protein